MKSESLEKSEQLVRKIFERLLASEILKEWDWPESKVYVLGLALWDIFSNNNEVVSSENKIYDIGSWRGSGSTLSSIIYKYFNESGQDNYNYMDFYMGSMIHLGDREISPEIYEKIFTVLKKMGCKWRYWNLNAQTRGVMSKLPKIVEAYKAVFEELPEESA